VSGSNLKVVAARKLGVPCNEKCRLKCINNITIDERRVIHEKYWEMGDLNRRCEFIMTNETYLFNKSQVSSPPRQYEILKLWL